MTEERNPKLQAYVKMLEKWSGSIPLVSKRLLVSGGIWSLIETSVPAAAFIENRQALLVDIGSGGGIPAIPLIIERPAIKAVLIEPNGRKAEFLREAVSRLALESVTVVEDRFEDVPLEDASARYFTVRALGIAPFDLIGDFLRGT